MGVHNMDLGRLAGEMEHRELHRDKHIRGTLVAGFFSELPQLCQVVPQLGEGLATMVGHERFIVAMIASDIERAREM